MNREYFKWVSPILEREMEVLAFGHQGVPVLVFPTASGRFFDYENNGMVEALDTVIDRGSIRLYCVDGIDEETWFNKSIPPRNRVSRHVLYEQYVLEEVLPFIHGKSGNSDLVVTGCDFGAFHAMNFTLRHPRAVGSCICVSGTFDIRPLLDGYFDEGCYFNNPVEYLANLTDEKYLRWFREIRFVLAAGEWDHALDANLAFSHLLDTRGIRHWLDIWGDHTKHDWPWWQMMIRKFLS
jgi:esterase/lipase superfamily enzyme